jgi:hypothetical protein
MSGGPYNSHGLDDWNEAITGETVGKREVGNARSTSTRCSTA